MAKPKKPATKSATQPESPKLSGNRQWINGAQFSDSQLKDVDLSHPANAVHAINHKYANLGLSVPNSTPMGGAVSSVQPEGRVNAQGVRERYYPRGAKKGQPIGKMVTATNRSQKLNKQGFNKFFMHPATGELHDEIQNMDGLRQHPGFQNMVSKFVDQYHKTASDPAKAKAALDFYPNEQRQVRDVGERFNAARAKKGMSQYFPGKPELAGALLQGGYSQNNTEANRKKMVEKSASTGELQPHLSTQPDKFGKPGQVTRAIEQNIHPMEAFGTKKLRDFTGSILGPETYNGTHGGVQLGTGHTVDRHEHDTAVGRDFGNIPLKLSSGGADHRRYRVIQAAMAEAHARVNPKLAVPQFQSMTWTGH
jgi:hypothetical protein